VPKGEGNIMAAFKNGGVLLSSKITSVSGNTVPVGNIILFSHIDGKIKYVDTSNNLYTLATESYVNNAVNSSSSNTTEIAQISGYVQSNTNSINTLYSTYANSTTVAQISAGLNTRINSITIAASAALVSDFDLRYVNVTGDTMIGNLSLSGSETNAIPLLNNININSNSALNVSNIKNQDSNITISNASSFTQTYPTINNHKSYIYIENVGSGQVLTNLVANYRTGGLSFSGAVTGNNVYGIFIEPMGVSNNAHVDNMYGIYLPQNQIGTGGTVTNLYGIYQEDASATNELFGPMKFHSSTTLSSLSGNAGKLLSLDANGTIVTTNASSGGGGGSISVKFGNTIINNVTTLELSGAGVTNLIDNGGGSVTAVFSISGTIDQGNITTTTTYVTGNSFTPNDTSTSYSYTLNNNATIY
jgi:hypothetical protein